MVIQMQLAAFAVNIDKFLKFIRSIRCLSNNTQRAYRADLSLLEKFWREQCPELPLQAVVQKFIVNLLYNQQLATKSIARKFSSLKTFAKFIARKGIELHIVGKSPKLRVNLPEVLSIEEIATLGEAITANPFSAQFAKRDRLIFELLYATGMRSFELVNVRLEDIDLESKTIRVWGKGQQERIVLFGQRAKQCLEDYLHGERKTKKSTKHNFLMINSRRSKLDTRHLRKLFEHFSKLLPLGKKVCPHTLRHSFATHMLSQGVDLRVVQELLGHKRITATQIYTQISMQAMADFFSAYHPLNEIEKPESS